MKKILICLGLLIVTGCGCSKTEELSMDNAIKNMQNLNNYNIIQEMIVTQDGTKTTIKNDINVDNKNKINMNKMTVKSNTSLSYLDINNQKSYINVNNSWYSFSQEVAQIDFNLLNNIEKEQIDNKFKINLNAEAFKNMVNNDYEGEANLSSANVYVYIENNYITKMTFDFEVANGDTTTSFNITNNFSKFNEVGDLSIPSEAINAMDEDILDIMNDATMYIFEVNYYCASNNLVTTTFTNTDLKYEGVKPDSVNLEIVDGMAKTGSIEISGYRFTITNGEISKREKID